MRVRLGECKYNGSCQGDTSVVVPFVLCFVVDVCPVRSLCTFFLFRLGLLSGAYWKTAVHSSYDMFCKYKYLIVNLVFPTSGFGVGISF